MPQLFFSSSDQEAKRLSALCRKGRLRRIRQGVYTDGPPESDGSLINSRWHEVVAYLYPDAIAAYRTAYELKPVDGFVVIVANIKKPAVIKIGWYLRISVQPGDPSIGHQQFLPELSRSNVPRFLLENLTPSRDTAAFAKSFGAGWVEEYLAKELQKRGETELNAIRDQARELSSSLGLESQYTQLDKIIGALLSSRPVDSLTNQLAIATAKHEPYDTFRLQRFEELAEYLSRFSFPHCDYQFSSASWRNLSFFESYFSNFIEGTEFLIEEAEEIVFKKQTVNQRHQDSHDVLALYELTHDYQEMITTPQTPDELLSLLQMRHQLMMAERPDKRPGQFKEKNNQAGDTLFVEPQLLEGTLTQAFEYYLSLPKGLSRAIYMQFMISECHPFDDGNGRLSRLMMNAELTEANSYKIIVPTVHRDSYHNGLRQATREGKFRTLCKVFYQLQCYTASVNWQDYGEALEKIEDDYCLKLPDDGVAVFNRKISAFKIELPVR